MHRSSLLIAAAALLAAPLAAQMPDRSAPPELGPPPSLDLPPVRRRTLSNGLRVILMEKHQVPLVQINVVVKAGTASDAPDKLGVASMAAAMLDEGAGDRDALALADAIDFLGARLSVGGDAHVTRVNLHTPISKLDPALALLADVVLRPRFDPAELDRQVKQRITQLIQARDEPRALASIIYDRSLFGETHPYGRMDIGTPSSLRSMTVEDLRRFHDTWFRPNNAAIVVVGDVEEGAMLAKLEAAFGAWRPGAVPEVRIPAPRQVERREVILVDKPGAAQSEIRIGRIGVARDTPDYYAITVMNTILGGSFSSRLNQNLREDKGYTYGARSGFEMRPAPGAFTAAAAVQTAVTDSALMEFMKELNGIRDPVPADELTRARNYVALRFPARFETVAGVAGQLDDLFLYDLLEDYFDQYVPRTLVVDRAAVRRVAREYIRPDRMLVVVVGDRASIEAGIRALDLGPVRVLTVEDVMGPPPETGE